LWRLPRIVCHEYLSNIFKLFIQNIIILYNSSLSKNSFSFNCFKLRCDERFTHAFTAHVVSFSNKLRWLAETKVITLKTQLHAVNARWKRLSQLSLICHQNGLSYYMYFYLYFKFSNKAARQFMKKSFDQSSYVFLHRIVCLSV
jgi:hypothetical protein